MDALLLVEPKHFWPLHVARLRHWQREWKPGRRRMGALGVAISEPQLDLANILVYRLRDLKEVQERVERSYRIAEALHVLAASTGPRRRTISRWLLNEADIRSAFDRVKKAQAPARPSPHAPLRKSARKKAVAE
jgi:hypothetical protein